MDIKKIFDKKADFIGKDVTAFTRTIKKCDY